MLMKSAILRSRIVGRQFSTSKGAVQPKHPLGLRMDKNSFREGFLQDPSVYPLICILGAGLTFMCGMGAHALYAYKDVQVDPRKRNMMIQTWGTEPQDSLTKRVTQRIPRRMENLEEGLGVDHKEWLKQKQGKK